MRPSRLVALASVLAAAGCSSTHAVSASGTGAYEAALAVVQHRLVTAWYDTRDGNAEIYLRALDAAGDPIGPEHRVTSDAAQSYEASIDGIGPDVAVAWYDKTGRDYTSHLALWDLEGHRRWSVAIAHHARNPVVRAHADRLFVAWIQADPDRHEAVWAGWWDAHGAAVVPPRLLAQASNTTWNLNTAIDDHGTAWVAFDAVNETQTSELFLVRVGDQPAPATRLTRDDGHESKYPDIALRGNHAAITWFDAKDGNTEVYLATFELEALAQSADVTGRRVTMTPGNSIGAYLAWNGDRLGLVWSDDTEGQDEIYFQSFDSRGRPLTPTSRVTRTRLDSLIPAVRPFGSGFALAWNEYERSVSDGHGDEGDGDEHGGRSEIAVALVR